MLGLFDLPDAVGVLSVALKLVEPMLLVFGVVSISLSARIAALNARGEVPRAESVIAATVRKSLVWAIPIGLVLVLFADPLLGLFGAGFDEARTSLLILVPAFLFSIVAGIGPAALMMSDYQRETIIAKAVGLMLNIVICLVFIPEHGASAAALALAIDIVATNLIAVVMAWRLLGLNTTAIPTPGWIRNDRGKGVG